MPLPFYPQGNKPWYPMDKRLGGPQIRSGHSGVEKNSQPLSGLEPPDHLASVKICLIDAFPIQNGLKQEKSLSPLLFNFGLNMPSGRSKKIGRDRNRKEHNSFRSMLMMLLYWVKA
jgi:hypothetical protein